jgi:hypothetical protein
MNDERETGAEQSEAEPTCRSATCGAPVDEHGELCCTCWEEKYGTDGAEFER